MTGIRQMGLVLGLLASGVASQAQGQSYRTYPTTPVGPLPALPATAPAPLPPVPDATPRWMDHILRTQAVAEPPGVTPETRQEEQASETAAPPTEAKLGPTPVDEVKFLQKLIYGDEADKAKLKFYGWADMDYTYRSTGTGRTDVAPVMNRFGDEFLFRQLALRIEKPLDPKDWSWGFNAQPYAGADPAFLNPTKGALITNPNPRFGFDFSDLNLTAHLPVLTEGGIDVKAGRQTTVIGSQAAQAPWRVFNSSDYQWYIAEEGRYTGISATWHVTKQLDFHAGMEFGWGTFYDELNSTPTFISQINYFLQEDKKTLLTFTILTGPEGQLGGYRGLNTTVVELRVTQNWSKYFTQIIQSHMGYSAAPIFGPYITGYQERFYSLYAINSYHLTPTVDINFRAEWYDDVDGLGYPGGLGKGPNNYYEVTAGVDYHPVKWLQLRPEIRGDFADRNPAFGDVDRPDRLRKDQLSLSCDALFKF